MPPRTTEIPPPGVHQNRYHNHHLHQHQHHHHPQAHSIQRFWGFFYKHCPPSELLYFVVVWWCVVVLRTHLSVPSFLSSSSSSSSSLSSLSSLCVGIWLKEVPQGTQAALDMSKALRQELSVTCACLWLSVGPTPLFLPHQRAFWPLSAGSLQSSPDVGFRRGG